jgi:FkbM family methyltransferase
MTRFRAAEMLTPLIRRVPRGGRTLYRWALGDLASHQTNDFLERNLPPKRRYRTLFDRRIGARVKLDLATWDGRRHFFLGRLHESGLLLMMEGFLRPGDTFLDVGANIGVYTLRASRLVGPTGIVYGFEPHPTTCEILRSQVEMNGMENVHVHNVGVSDASSTLTLSVYEGTRQMASFRSGDGAIPAASIRVARLDEILDSADLPGRLLAKVDTEGFDHRVIRGMGRLLDRRDLALWVEINDGWLRDQGSSAASLFGDLAAAGFVAHLPSTSFRGMREVLTLEQMTGPLPRPGYDAVFMRPDTALDRVAIR